MSYETSTIVKLAPKEIPEFLQAAKDFGMDEIALEEEEFNGPFIRAVQTGPNEVTVKGDIMDLGDFLQEMVPDQWDKGYGTAGIFEALGKPTPKKNSSKVESIREPS